MAGPPLEDFLSHGWFGPASLIQIVLLMFIILELHAISVRPHDPKKAVRRLGDLGDPLSPLRQAGKRGGQWLQPFRRLQGIGAQVPGKTQEGPAMSLADSPEEATITLPIGQPGPADDVKFTFKGRCAKLTAGLLLLALGIGYVLGRGGV